jgi:hypothetical protein
MSWKERMTSNGDGGTSSPSLDMHPVGMGALAHGAVLDTVDEPRPGAPLDDAWARLWFTLERHHWSTLALVAVTAHAAALGTARALVSVARTYRRGEVRLLDATGLAPNAIHSVVSGMPDVAAAGLHVVMAVDSPLTNPAAIAIARSADAILLVVLLGESKLSDMRRVVDAIGRERFIGSAALRRRVRR